MILPSIIIKLAISARALHQEWGVNLTFKVIKLLAGRLSNMKKRVKLVIDQYSASMKFEVVTLTGFMDTNTYF